MNFFLICVDGKKCSCTETEAMQYMTENQIDYLSNFALSNSSHISFTIPEDRNKNYHIVEITKENIAMDFVCSPIRVVETSDAFAEPYALWDEESNDYCRQWDGTVETFYTEKEALSYCDRLRVNRMKTEIKVPYICLDFLNSKNNFEWFKVNNPSELACLARIYPEVEDISVSRYPEYVCVGDNGQDRYVSSLSISMESMRKFLKNFNLGMLTY